MSTRLTLLSVFSACLAGLTTSVFAEGTVAAAPAAAATPAVENAAPATTPAAPLAVVAPAASPEVSAPKVETAAPAKPDATAPKADAAKPVEPADDTIVIDYNEADMQRVLRTLATKAGVNLIVGEEVGGKVTVHLEGVGYEEALRLIIESKGYAFVKEKTVVRVKSKESLDAEPVELRVVVLAYAKADDIKKSVDQVLTGRGKSQVDTRSNSLIISDTPANLAKVIPLIQSLDTQTPQVLIEAKFVETTRNPKKDLGINWTGTMVNHKVAFGADNGTTIGNFMFSKDLRPGGSWMPTAALLDVGQASLVFSFLNQDTDTELLANPRIVTTDNNKAKISIATQYPIPSFSFSEQTASLQISGFEYKDIGIILNVTPRINKNSYVTLEVAPEASSSSENSTLQSGGGSAVLIPIINTRTATTTVLIKSGNTLAIGGLMRQDSSDSYSKIPVLGDIPGMGPMFRSKSLSKTKRDLLIFLTPTIIAPDAQTGYEGSVNGINGPEVFANDKWMPRDNAKPQSQLKR